jgi:hypothetical protein
MRNDIPVPPSEKENHDRRFPDIVQAKLQRDSFGWFLIFPVYVLKLFKVLLFDA